MHARHMFYHYTPVPHFFTLPPSPTQWHWGWNLGPHICVCKCSTLSYTCLLYKSLEIGIRGLEAGDYTVTEPTGSQKLVVLAAKEPPRELVKYRSLEKFKFSRSGWDPGIIMFTKCPSMILIDSQIWEPSCSVRGKLMSYPASTSSPRT